MNKDEHNHDCRVLNFFNQFDFFTVLIAVESTTIYSPNFIYDFFLKQVRPFFQIS